MSGPVQSTVAEKERPFLGASIRNKQVIYSSVTQISIFDRHIDGGCPAKWAYQYLPQIQVPPPFTKKPLKTKSQSGGVDYAQQLDHWFKTGEMIFTPTLLEAKRFIPSPWNSEGKLDIESETPLGPDLKRAIDLRLDWLRPENEPYRDTIAEEIKKLAGLTADGVPIDGAWDFRHFRGEYIDEDGILKPERYPAETAEINDLKTTSRINPERVFKGKDAGTIRRGYAKTRAEILDYVQNLGYGQATADAKPHLRYIRLGNIYAQTTKKYAEKRTGILHVDEIRERWHKRGDAVVREMQQVALVDKVDEVEGNIAACDAFTHVDPRNPGVTLTGCGHRYYCPFFAKKPIQPFGPPTSVAQGDSKMSTGRSLFDTLGAAPTTQHVPAPPAPPAPPLSPEDRARAVAHERALLLAAEQPVHPPAPPAPQFVLPLDDMGRVEDEDEGDDVEFVTPPPPVAFSVGAVLPPDAPRHASMLDAAAPVPASAVAEITNPELRARVEEHNRQHAEREATASAAAPKKVGGRCPGAGQTVQISVVEAMKKKVTCPHPGCGVEKPIPKEVRDASLTSMAFPGHNVPKAESIVSTPPSPPAAPVPAPPAPPQLPFAAPVPPMPPIVSPVPAPPTPPSPPVPVQVVASAPSPAPLASNRSTPHEVPVAGDVLFTTAEVDLFSAVFRDKFTGVPQSTFSPAVIDMLRRLKLIAG